SSKRFNILNPTALWRTCGCGKAASDGTWLLPSCTLPQSFFGAFAAFRIPDGRDRYDERKPDRDARALPDPAVVANRSAMELDQALDDRKAEPGSFVLAVEAIVDLVERVADPGQGVGRNADPGILDADLHHVAVSCGAER